MKNKTSMSFIGAVIFIIITYFILDYFYISPSMKSQLIKDHLKARYQMSFNNVIEKSEVQKSLFENTTFEEDFKFIDFEYDIKYFNNNKIIANLLDYDILKISRGIIKSYIIVDFKIRIRNEEFDTLKSLSYKYYIIRKNVNKYLIYNIVELKIESKPYEDAVGIIHTNTDDVH